jgi:hypothetical protein
MTMIEDRLQAAMHAAAETVADDSAPPLRLTEQASRLGVRRRVSTARSRWFRFLAPVAAATAVLAITATAVVIADAQSRHRQAASGSALDRLPQYYLTMPNRRNAAFGNGWPSVVVKDTRTGATVVKVRPPDPYHSFAGITGAADDRSFVLAARPASGSITGPSQDIVKLFGARLNPAKRTLQLTPLPIPLFTSSAEVDGIALSPSGTELAVAMQTGSSHNQLVIRLYSMTGQVLKSWHSPGILGYFWLNPANMSWTRTGVLAINWTFYARNFRHDESGLWLLNTGTPGGRLVNQSRLVVPGKELNGFAPWGDGLVSADGSTMIVPMVSLIGPGAHGDRGKIQEFSAATGRPTHALWPVYFGGPHAPLGIPGEVVMWSNASGSVLVAQADLVSGHRSDGKTAMGVLSGKHFTPIPGAPSTKLTYYGLVF